jgi:hypothetical protein
MMCGQVEIQTGGDIIIDIAVVVVTIFIAGLVIYLVHRANNDWGAGDLG